MILSIRTILLFIHRYKNQDWLIDVLTRFKHPKSQFHDFFDGRLSFFALRDDKETFDLVESNKLANNQAEKQTNEQP